MKKIFSLIAVAGGLAAVFLLTAAVPPDYDPMSAFIANNGGQIPVVWATNIDNWGTTWAAIAKPKSKYISVSGGGVQIENGQLSYSGVPYVYIGYDPSAAMAANFLGGIVLYAGTDNYTKPMVWISRTNIYFASPIDRVANPIAAIGGKYVTPGRDGFLRVCCIASNTASAWLTNLTTGDVVFLGQLTGAGTNYHNAKIRVGPGDVVSITNVNGGFGVINSEWRN